MCSGFTELLCPSQSHSGPWMPQNGCWSPGFSPGQLGGFSVLVSAHSLHQTRLRPCLLSSASLTPEGIVVRALKPEELMAQDVASSGSHTP